MLKSYHVVNPDDARYFVNSWLLNNFLSASPEEKKVFFLRSKNKTTRAGKNKNALKIYWIE